MGRKKKAVEEKKSKNDETTDSVEVDSDYLPVSRKVEPLGQGWVFEKWASQGDEWKNAPPYQILVAYEHMIDPKNHKGKEFIRIRTGAEMELSQKKVPQDLQQASLDKIKIPIMWGVKGLPKNLCFFEYKIKE